ncbi:MAG TPA: ELWxxDGT repeat protein [Thermoanaerobaculia bacterium]|nr:ELWxxDGT repeat protein [Thermoanaerobaculia bacterium]
MRLVPVLLLGFAILHLPFSTAAAAPHLVADLNTGPAADPVSILLSQDDALTIVHDGVLYFSATDPAHGQELWRSDGTAAGTYRLTDICAGRCDSSPDNLTMSRGHLFFTADDGFSGRELWQSDGTPGSEQRVRDLCPGPCSSAPYSLLDSGDALFFAASNGQGQQLWRSDGTPGGTTLVATPCDLQPGQVQCIGRLQQVGRWLFFTVTTDTFSLWRSDGTPGGTGPFNDPAAVAVPWLTYLITDGDRAFFLTQDALWRTDGTVAGTARIKALSDLLPPPAQVYNTQAQIWNGLLFLFLGNNVAIVSDGTADGTISFPAIPSFSGGSSLVPLPDALLFVSEEHGPPSSLWRTRGTAATTERIFDLNGLDDPSNEDFIIDLTPLGDRALFRVERWDTKAVEIWETDGTAAGTRQLQGVEPGSADFPMFPAGSQAYFQRIALPAVELWRTDGTAAGTFPVHGFGSGPGSSGPLAQAALGDRLIFSAQTAEHRAPLFRSDGTPAGTRRLSGPASDSASWATGFTPAGNRLFFFSSAAVTYPGTDVWHLAANGLWWTDGTPGGTAEVASKIVSFSPVGALDRKLLFAGADSIPLYFGGPDIELWSSIGNTSGHPGGPGTVRVKNINPFQDDTHEHHTCTAASSSPGPGVQVNGGLIVFAADDGTAGRELWATDGSRAGTRLVRDINPGRSNVPPAPECSSRSTTGLPSDPQGFVRFRQGALFTADDGVHGRELWWTDGTWQGTRRVADLRPGAAGSEPHDLTAFRNAVYFIASPDGHGESLWRTDGTARGTIMVADLKVGGTTSWARSLTAAGDQLFLAVYNESTGPELWVSRGDATSTRMVVDLRPGPAGSSPQELTAAGNVIVFAADDGEHGQEPWRSDGTAAGTVRLGDINPGRDASSPGPFTVAGPWIFTGAYDPEHGRELWAIPLAEALHP